MNFMRTIRSHNDGYQIVVRWWCNYKADADFGDSDRRLEGILSGYTDEEPEVLEYKVNIRDEQKVHLVCRHPLSGQKVRYRMHTDPEGIVIKVEREDKTKSKTVWETLSLKK